MRDISAPEKFIQFAAISQKKEKEKKTSSMRMLFSEANSPQV